jgi:hypothetical protein
MIGDYVQWTSGGVEQFPQPRKVMGFNGRHVFVHGSATGLPVEQVTVVDPPKPTPAAALANSAYTSNNEESKADLSVLLVGNRLQITANVDAKGIARLKQVLDKYEEILKLLQ